MGTPETRWKHSMMRFDQSVEIRGGLELWGTAVFRDSIVLKDGKKLILGTDSDASVWHDGTRLRHANAEILFRNHVSIPLYATTDQSFLTQGIFVPDRACVVKAIRVGFTTIVGTTVTVPLRVGVRPTTAPTTTEWLIGGGGAGIIGSVDLSIIGTTYFSHEYELTTNAAAVLLAAGDYVYASVETKTLLPTAGAGGVLTLEYEVYE